MTDEERMDYYNKAGRAFQREIEAARLQEVLYRRLSLRSSTLGEETIAV